MSKEELRRKIISKGVLPESVTYVLKAVTAFNRTLIFDGLRSEDFYGPDGIIEMDINSHGVDLYGKFDEGYAPDAFIRISEPRGYIGGYSSKMEEIQLITGIQTESGEIIATQSRPGAFGLHSPAIGYYNPATVAAYMKTKANPAEEKFGIIFDADPDMIVDLKCQVISYRKSLESSALVPLLEKGKVRKQTHK